MARSSTTLSITRSHVGELAEMVGGRDPAEDRVALVGGQLALVDLTVEAGGRRVATTRVGAGLRPRPDDDVIAGPGGDLGEARRP